MYAALLEGGDGIDGNSTVSAAYLKLAADQGIEAAQLRYGQMLEMGMGVAQDLDEALSYRG
jgi:TPR repeat protein